MMESDAKGSKPAKTAPAVKAASGAPGVLGVLGVSEVPDATEAPAAPGTPGALDAPEAPDAPAAPAEPAVKDAPAEPAVKDAPVAKAAPGAPGVLGVLGVSEAPDATEAPAAPGTPGALDAPEAPDAPAAPAEPAVKDASAEPAVKDAPVASDATAVPDVPGAPGATGASDVEAAPDAKVRAARYLRENADLRRALNISPDAELIPEFLGQGEHNQNFWFADPATGTKYVLRINVLPQPFHENQVAYEFGALQLLRGTGCTPQPLYLDDTTGALPHGALVISFCEGQELNFDALRPGDLRAVAQIMANVHAAPVPADAPLFRPADPLRALYDECVTRFQVYLHSAYEEPRITKWVERLIKEAQMGLETAPSAQECMHVINTETLPSHFLIPEASAKAAAQAGESGRFGVNPGTFVDWERPIIGEVAQDLAYFVSPTTTFWDSSFLFPPSMVDGFLEDYWRAVDGRFSALHFAERFKAYRMMTVLRSTTWCAKALIQYHQPDAYQTARTREKLPIYLSDEFLERVYSECFQ